MQVTATTPLVDVRSATTGQDITLELTESLPTGRSYQSYLQLVPGVLPDDQAQSGNPAARSGLNYSDIGGNVGISADNVYYFDGINVTDPVTGTFGANLNTEIIQEQHVVTGAIPAEFVGAPGLISNVITKSGSNAFHGSANYFFQNSGLVAENKNGAAEEFSTKDSAFTFGGPALQGQGVVLRQLPLHQPPGRRVDARYQRVHALGRQHAAPGLCQGQLGGDARSDLFSFTYMSDPTEISGRRQRDITNARDRAREQGGARYGATYTRVWGGTLLEIGANKHNGEVTDLSAIRESRNDVLFQTADVRVLTDEQMGGFGRDLIDQRDNKAHPRLAAARRGGNHTIKGGAEWNRSDNFRDTRVSRQPRVCTTLADKYRGGDINAANVAGGGWSGLTFDVTNDQRLQRPDADHRRERRSRRVLQRLRRQPRRHRVGGRARRRRWCSTPPTPPAARTTSAISRSSTGPQETYSKGLSVLHPGRDARFNRLTLNVGLRTERWEHFDTTGENIFTFPWEFAPRLSASYDILGNGRHKASAFWGRYYDPVRNNMTNFAGTLTGSVVEEQVYVGGAQQVRDLPHARRRRRCRTRSSRRPRRRRTPTTCSSATPSTSATT